MKGTEIDCKHAGPAAFFSKAKTLRLPRVSSGRNSLCAAKVRCHGDQRRLLSCVTIDNECQLQERK